MTEIERAKRLLKYDAWANLQTIRALPSVAATTASMQTQQEPPKSIAKLVAHIIGAEWNWLARIRGERPPMAIWPHIAVPDLERAMSDVQVAWRAYLDSQSNDELGRVVTYTNSKGDEYRNTVFDIVTQVVIHSEHHRGQIAQTVRSLDGQPALTDYIQYARTAGA
ncbi:MAG TPA: DinB family protein [Gemmatimonadaceae bacterium]